MTIFTSLLIMLLPLVSLADVCTEKFGAGYVAMPGTSFCMPTASSADMQKYYSEAAKASSFSTPKKDIPEIKPCYEYGGRETEYQQLKDDALNIQKMALTSDMSVVCKDMNDGKSPAALAVAKKLKTKEPLTPAETKIKKVGLNPWSLSIPENQEAREWVFNDMGGSFENDWGIQNKNDLKMVLSGEKELATPEKNDRLKKLINNADNGASANTFMISPMVKKELESKKNKAPFS